MVTIVKGKMRKRIPYSAYKNYYENSGWEVEDGKGLVSMDSDISESTDDEWDSVIEEEKPLSEMNRQELTEKAAKMGIDISDLSNNKQIRDRIKTYL